MEGIFINGEKAKFHPEDILDTNASQYTEEIGTATKEWLSENLTPESAGVVDKTLSIEGAAADAKKTGDEIDALKSKILNLTATAQTLPEGASASASYDAQTGVMTFGIPKGERGLTGASGVYIGDTEPTDEGINVWIDTSADADDKSSPIVGVGQAGYMQIKE